MHMCMCLCMYVVFVYRITYFFLTVQKVVMISVFISQVRLFTSRGRGRQNSEASQGCTVWFCFREKNKLKILNWCSFLNHMQTWIALAKNWRTSHVLPSAHSATCSWASPSALPISHVRFRADSLLCTCGYGGEGEDADFWCVLGHSSFSLVRTPDREGLVNVPVSIYCHLCCP